jgi:hypothetical protein
VSLDPAAVATAVDEVGALLRLDGADLRLLEADPATDRVHLQLVLENASCADCILPPVDLVDAIEHAIKRRSPGELELIVEDPRR